MSSPPLPVAVDLAGSRPNLIRLWLLSGGSWAWHWPALRLLSFSAFFITFKCYLPTSSYCNWGFTYLYPCLLHFHYENIYCLLFAAEPKRMLQLHFFLLGPSCFSFFDMVLHRLSLSAPLCIPGSPGDSPPGTLRSQLLLRCPQVFLCHDWPFSLPFSCFLDPGPPLRWVISSF